jgi:anti-sigma B factor antagonist
MDNLPITFEIVSGVRPGQIVMVLKGPLTLRSLFSFQDAVRAESSPELILDFSDVPYVDSAGLGAIVNAHISRSNSGRRLLLAGVPDRVLTMFRVARLDQVLAIFPNLQAAQETK